MEHDLTLEEAATVIKGSTLEEDGLLIKRPTALKRVRTLDSATLKSFVEKRGMEWKEGYLERHIPYWASDERPDHDREIVVQNWDFSMFEKNSPLLLDHNLRSLPLGRLVNWGVENRTEQDYKGKALHLDAVFAEDDEGAERIFRLVKGGILIAGSCGFKSRRVSRVPKDDKRKAFADFFLDDNRLHEFSVTSVGANPGAVVATKMRAIPDLMPGDINLMRELTRLDIKRGEGDSSAWAQKELGWLVVAKALFPACEFTPHSELDEPIQVVDPFDRLTSLEQKMERVLQTVSDISSQREKSFEDALAEEIHF